ncbi:MAG TPA: phenylalanine--tRNA ligase subunit beta [Bryobacteraceae bacterium]|nr:phenylalanine--tRNA ligase subunit beta [Bryobacteraceae bacterium]
MKFSYNWIREFVENLDTPAAPLERLITMKTAECEGIESAGELLDSAVAARIESVEFIEGSHNVKAVVETGRYGVKTVVCGAPNCRAGRVTAYVPVGKKLVSGIESDGMLASGAELGINRESSGIIELSSQVGAPLAGCVRDYVIEIDNKSITHRPDLWGHLGMAREVAAILGRRLCDPVKMHLLPDSPSPVKIEIPDLDVCPRYSALVIENVTVKPSPLWLQCRLTAIGLNPINNLVDLTNYIMAELAQPMHAFDRDLLKGDTIWARPARHGERFTALNEEEYTLGPQNVAIADAGGPIALGGVIGGLESAISEKTTRIVLESANFQGSSIRKTSSALKLRTDASMRFEKSQDPRNTVRALARAVELLELVAPGFRIVGGLADTGREIRVPPPIELPMDWLVRKLGRDVSEAEVRDILERLEFGVSEVRPRVLSVTVPSWRATRDIAVKDDLVEEVGRMVGYDSITPKAPLVATNVPPSNEERAFHHAVRDICAAQGFTEVYNYSFVSEEQARAFHLDPAAHLAVANPIASDQGLLRMSLIPGIWSNIVENSKQTDQFRLFEIGREIHKCDAGLPEEIPHLAAAVYARHGDGTAGLFEAKRAAECLMDGVEARPAEARAYEHPARTAELVWRGRVVGRLFELHPSMVEGRAAVLDINLNVMRELSAREKRYTPIRRFPSIGFDLSVLAGKRELVAGLRDKLAGFAGPMLESIEYVRQYSGPPLADDVKSVSFRLTLGSPERTLASDEAGRIRAAIIDGMRGLGYELRV